MAKIVVMILKNRMNLSEEYFDIDVFLEDKKTQLNAFLDTGNTIHEPFSKRSVVFVEGEEIRDFFPKEIYDLLIKGEGMEEIKEDFDIDEIDSLLIEEESKDLLKKVIFQMTIRLIQLLISL